jgi:hypothetical protein
VRSEGAVCFGKLRPCHPHQNVEIALRERAGNGRAADVMDFRTRQKFSDFTSVLFKRRQNFCTNLLFGCETDKWHTLSASADADLRRFAELDKKIHSTD